MIKTIVLKMMFVVLVCRFNYDSILRRMIVRSDETFYGLHAHYMAPNFEQDPPIFACRFSEAAGYEHILALANEDGRVAIQVKKNYSFKYKLHWARYCITLK